MFAKVYVLTLLSEVHLEQGRYAVSCDVVLKNKTGIIKKKRKSEEQVYVDHKSVIGGLSPEIELQLKNHKCEIQLAISGALKPQSKFEKGENVIEYNESLSECRRLLALVPTYDEAAEGIATIKFKVQGKVKHAVTIHGVPTTNDLNKSESSSNIREAGASQQTIDEGSVMAGEGRWTGGAVHALPHPSRPLERGMENLAIGQRRPDVVPPEDSHDFETAYGNILCNESLSTLSWALSPSDANRLLIGMGVPNQIHAQNQKNHQGDIVTCNYESLRYWRNQRKSRTQQHEASNKQLYEDLLCELDDIGRKDIKAVIKTTLESNKKFEKTDFNHL